MNYVGRRDAADQVVREIEEASGQAISVQGDISQSQDAKNLFDAAIERFTSPIWSFSWPVTNQAVLQVKISAPTADWREHDNLIDGDVTRVRAG